MSVLSSALYNENMQQYVLDEKNDPQLLIIATMINQIESNGIDTVDEEITLTLGKINGEYKIKNDEQLATLLSDKLNLSQKEATPSTDEETAA